jgi:splicing factor U2AF subunit
MVYFNSWEEERAWVEDRRRKRLARKTLWDVPPTADQAALDARSAAMTNFAATDFSGVDPNSNLPQQTRHARRLYVGNLPAEVTEDSLHKFFKDSIATALVKPIDEDPILSVYINHERHFCFLEFKSVEMTTACMALDGINIFGRGKVKVKRPNDYNLTMAPNSNMLPEMDVSKLGIISSSVQDGPDKIFIGGLHYNLTEEQVVELLSAFGKVKAFHLVKQEPDAATSKGYCFAEYADHSVTQVAVMGLNGMDLGQGKILTARIANEKDNAMVVPLAVAAQHQQQASSNNMPGQYNVEELVDAAMGLRPMPTAPSLLGLPVIPLVPTSTPLAIPMSLPPPPSRAPPPPPMTAVLDIANKVIEQAFHDKTRIVVLLNMVAAEDLATDQDHQELVAEVREECAKFGNLLSIKIPRPSDAGIEASAVKKIFLEYATVQDAAKAQGELNGRKFGPNTVMTSFLSEGDYAAGKLR